MAKRTNYDEATKAAVMGALLAGQAVSELAEKYNIPPETIRSWKSRQSSGENLATVATTKKERIGQLILDVLEAQLEASLSMTNVFKDTEWLKKQEASEVAVLFGVIQDKTYRILEALPDESDEAAGG